MKTIVEVGEWRVSAGTKVYVLALMTSLTTFNYLDRVLMALLLQPIKVDLNLSDTQLGFLTGIAFSLFYATLGLPISRWADRGNRVTIASLAIGLWGLTVMACLFVSNFVQLLLARIAAAVGESGCIPPTYSLVGDYFPKPGERARAMAIYVASNPLAVLIGYIAGGWLSERFGWRAAFFVVGIPALFISVLVKFTISETPAHLTMVRDLRRRVPPLTYVLTTLWCQRSTRHLVIGFILFWTLGWGLTPWYAAFLMRSHGMSTAEVGVWFGLVVGITGIVGMVLGGHVAGKWFSHDERKQMRLTASMLASVVPCFALFLLLPQKSQALFALIPLVLVFNCFSGPIYALMQRLVPDEMRATALAVVLMLGNLIGMGIGPQIVGILSDVLRPSLGNDSLRYAMLSMSLVAFWGAYHFWRVGRTITADIQATQHAGRPPTEEAAMQIS